MKRNGKQAMAAVVLASALGFGLSIQGASAAEPENIPEWATAEFAEWRSLGLLQGDEHGEVHPYDAVKKAEFAAFVNRVFNFREQGHQTFKDVPPDAWYAADIGKATAAGVLEGSGGGLMLPLEELSREKAALMLYRVFDVQASGRNTRPFDDDASISPWAKEAVYAMKENGYISGTSEGVFEPLRPLTRAEAVKMIHNVMGQLIASDGTYSKLAGKNLVVNTAGGTLTQARLTGNLYITPGVGEGDLTIADSRIGGTIYVNGGGEHTITLRDSSVGQLVIRKPSGTVRVLVDGNSSIGSVTLASRSILQLDAGEVGELLAAEPAEGSEIRLGVDATVERLTADAGLATSGEGEIGEAVVNAEQVTLARKPKKLILNAGEATVEGKTVKKGEQGSGSGTGTVPGGGGGNSGGGDPGPGTPTEQATKRYTHAEALASLGGAGAEGQVKQYLTFLQDPTYTPAIADPDAKMPDLVNALTFVNYEFDVKPSIFPSLRNVNTSVLNAARTVLWIGTDEGVTRIDLQSNAMKEYTAAGEQLADDRVLLLLGDGANGVWAVTETGVSHIYQ